MTETRWQELLQLRPKAFLRVLNGMLEAGKIDKLQYAGLLVKYRREKLREI